MGQQAPLSILLKVFPEYPAAETLLDAVDLHLQPMWIDRLHSVTIIGKAITGPMLCSIFIQEGLDRCSFGSVEGSSERSAARRVRRGRNLAGARAWERSYRRSNSFADELLFSIEVNGWSEGTPSLVESVVSIYE